MNRISPAVLAITILALAASALIVWMTRPESPAPPPSMAEAPVPVAPRAAPEPEWAPAATATPEPKPEAAKRVRRHPLGENYAARERARKASERERALDRLNELKYSDFEAKRIRDAWEKSLRQAEDELKELALEGRTIGGYEKRLARRGAWDRVRSDFGDVDYEAARYAADLSTWVGIRSVTPNSPAEALGLMAGDQLYSYNGQRIFDTEEVGTFWAAEPADGVSSLGFVRGGQLFFLDVDRGYLGVPLVGRNETPN